MEAQKLLELAKADYAHCSDRILNAMERADSDGILRAMEEKKHLAYIITWLQATIQANTDFFKDPC